MGIRLRPSDGYVAYACHRCLNGSMTREKDRLGDKYYLKCILCGAEQKIPENSERNAGTKDVPSLESESESEELS